MTNKKITNKHNKHTYGWVPDIPDHRDFMFGVHRKPVVEKLPSSVDLRSLCSTVEDQGNIGSCTAQALVGALELLEIKNEIVTYADLSRLFVYYNERVLEHSVNYDSGAMIRDGIKTLNTLGACTEKLWPYNISKFKTKPTPACYKDAIDHKIISYYRINTVDEMRTCLADGFPFVFGFAVYESFESDEVAQTGIVPMPTKGEQLLGGHAVLSVGYEDANQRFIVRNSWGTDWGFGGYFYMPFEYLGDRDLSDDLWTIRRIRGM